MSSSSSSEGSLPSQTDITRLIAPVYVGILASWLLFGVCAVQLYVYHVTPYNDRMLIWASVYGVFIVDIFQSIVGFDMGWGIMVAGWGQYPALITIGWEFVAMPIVSGAVGAWVQIFYAWRIHKLSQWKWLPAFIAVVALAGLSTALSITIGAARLTVIVGLDTLVPRICTWLSISVFVDSVITVAMVYLLYSKKKGTLFKHSERKINRLITLSVETGLASTTIAICDLVVFLANEKSNYPAVFTLLISKVYNIALLTSLNSREVSPQHARGGGVALMNLSSEGSAVSYPSRSLATSPTKVHISTTQEVFRPRGVLDVEKQVFPEATMPHRSGASFDSDIMASRQ
ncbi:hypothetical protein FA95DRAFT_1608372 [Auriscalpium vulgare]|uniref:Uncharacterized protein n=1 Tax=Auriscalpium vulgare TaxID=40419 RepID=A0ACB8RLW8_9AGAM|nr:hypothetical protein FA95DRAFT_1608372 [Auriscalpium vulgare]